MTDSEKGPFPNGAQLAATHVISPPPPSVRFAAYHFPGRGLTDDIMVQPTAFTVVEVFHYRDGQGHTIQHVVASVYDMDAEGTPGMCEQVSGFVCFGQDEISVRKAAIQMVAISVTDMSALPEGRPS